MVNVQEQYGEDNSDLSRELDALLHLLREIGAVGKVGQCIVRGIVPQPLFGQLALREFVFELSCSLRQTPPA